MADEFADLPTMRLLSPKRRAFVMAMASEPFGNASMWARMAGYSDKSGACKVSGFKCIHDPRVTAAAKEVAHATMHTLGPGMAVAGLLRLAADKDHRDHGRAVIALADRVGFAATQEIHVKHTDVTGEALLARLGAVAERLGLDARKLIGGNVIEGEAKEVKGDEI